MSDTRGTGHLRDVVERLAAIVPHSRVLIREGRQHRWQQLSKELPHILSIITRELRPSHILERAAVHNPGAIRWLHRPRHAAPPVQGGRRGNECCMDDTSKNDGLLTFRTFDTGDSACSLASWCMMPEILSKSPASLRSRICEAVRPRLSLKLRAWQRRATHHVLDLERGLLALVVLLLAERPNDRGAQHAEEEGRGGRGEGRWRREEATCREAGGG